MRRLFTLSDHHMRKTEHAWQRREVVGEYLTGTRDALPYLADLFAFALDALSRQPTTPSTVLDLGAGDGFFAEMILDAYPEACAILVDNSAEMHEAAAHRLKKHQGRYLIADLDLGMAGGLKKLVSGHLVNAVVSSFAIHHLTTAAKKNLYSEIAGVLPKGHAFVNVEHVSSRSSRFEDLWEERVAKNMARSKGIAPESDEFKRLLSDFKQRDDKKDNILEPLDDQLKWLEELGFSEVECTFRCLELSTIVAYK